MLRALAPGQARDGECHPDDADAGEEQGHGYAKRVTEEVHDHLRQEDEGADHAHAERTLTSRSKTGSFRLRKKTPATANATAPRTANARYPVPSSSQF